MQKKTLFFLLAILVIAVFFRLWKLNEIPPGLYPDVAIIQGYPQSSICFIFKFTKIN